jgi:hypothetical protein
MMDEIDPETPKLYVILETLHFEPIAAFFRIQNALRFFEDYATTTTSPCGLFDVVQLRWIQTNEGMRRVKGEETL